MLQTQGSHRQDAETIFVNQERILVGAMRGAAIFHDAQSASRNLIGYPMIEQDHAVGNILFQPMPCESAFAAFSGNDGADPFVFEPAKQSTQFRPQNALI